jgi:uncharacterized membrane protein
MKTKLSKLLIIRIILVLTMFIAAIILLPRLPEVVPVHWGFDGEANGWAPRVWGALMGPILALTVLVLFPLLSKIDPKKENYQNFAKAWNIIQTLLIAFFGYIFILQMYFTINPEQSALMGRLIMAGVGALLALIGNLLGKVRQNYFIGIRTPWAINDKEVWQKSQRVGGWVMFIVGIVFILEALIWQFVIPVFAISIVMVILVPTVYSYMLTRNRSKA